MGDTVRLVPVALADVDELHAFETANRAYFEARINPRAPDGTSGCGSRACAVVEARVTRS